MKKAIWGIVILLILSAGAFLVYEIFFDISDEERIQRNLTDFARLASRSPADTTSSNLLKCRQIENYIAPECSLAINVSMFEGKYTPRSVGAMALNCKSRFTAACITFSDIVIQITSPTTAIATFNASFDGKYKADGSEVDGVRELECSLKKIDGKWCFDSFSIQKILEK